MHLRKVFSRFLKFNYQIHVQVFQEHHQHNTPLPLQLKIRRAYGQVTKTYYGSFAGSWATEYWYLYFNDNEGRIQNRTEQSLAGK